MRLLYLALFIFTSPTLFAQKKESSQIESIYFHLYTDSLKKGTNNYINIDGKTKSGSWLPLNTPQIEFSSSACIFEGNELVVPASFTGDSITIKAWLKSDPKMQIEKTIWVKTLPDPELPSQNEVMAAPPTKKRKRTR